jgi:hypothetical protein
MRKRRHKNGAKIGVVAFHMRFLAILAAVMMTADAVMLPVWRSANGQPRAITDTDMGRMALSFTTELMADHENHQSYIPSHFICDARMTFDWNW